MVPINVIDSPKQLDEMKQKMQAALDSGCTRVLVCGGTGCMANGAPEVTAALQKELDARGIAVKVDLADESDAATVKLGYSGCPGFCQVGPIVRILPADFFLIQVKPEDAADVVEQTILGGKPVERLLYRPGKSGPNVVAKSSH